MPLTYLVTLYHNTPKWRYQGCGEYFMTVAKQLTINFGGVEEPTDQETNSSILMKRRINLITWNLKMN